jgi:hypothetical protein
MKRANGMSRGVTKNHGLDIVEGSAPSETEKETADRAGAGNIKAPAPRAGAGNIEAPASTARDREERNQF